MNRLRSSFAFLRSSSGESCSPASLRTRSSASDGGLYISLSNSHAGYSASGRMTGGLAPLATTMNDTSSGAVGSMTTATGSAAPLPLPLGLAGAANVR